MYFYNYKILLFKFYLFVYNNIYLFELIFLKIITEKKYFNLKNTFCFI